MGFWSLNNNPVRRLETRACGMMHSRIADHATARGLSVLYGMRLLRVQLLED
jgi:hypothetical protein